MTHGSGESRAGAEDDHAAIDLAGLVEEGHRLHPEAAEYVRGDTFVAQANIHYPTESGLILDGLTKICDLAPQLADLIDTSGWRQSKSLFKKAKKADLQRLVEVLAEDASRADAAARTAEILAELLGNG